MFKSAPKYLKNKDGLKEMSKEKIEEGKEKYEELLDDTFLDEVFGAESILPRDDWEEAVVEKAKWIFKPE